MAEEVVGVKTHGQIIKSKLNSARNQLQAERTDEHRPAMILHSPTTYRFYYPTDSENCTASIEG